MKSLTRDFNNRIGIFIHWFQDNELTWIKFNKFFWKLYTLNKASYFAIVALFMVIANITESKGQDLPKMTETEVRKVIAEGNIKWGKARVNFDTLVFNEMLAPDFYVNIWNKNYTRQEFIAMVSFQSPKRKLSRFDATVLTVQPLDDCWVAIIQEKLEHDTPDGKIYALWITKDGWKKVDGKWLITFSEAIGRENWWEGNRPPIKDW